MTDDAEIVAAAPTLLSAEDALWCAPCNWYHGLAVRVCGQCGGPLQPVRIETHSRDSPA